MTAMSVFFPLDTIRSRLQVEENLKSKNLIAMIQDLVKEEGMYELVIVLLFFQTNFFF